MIQPRLLLNSALKSHDIAPELSKKYLHDFLLIIHTTREQSIANLDTGAQFLRDVHASSEPAAFLFRSMDIKYIALFARNSKSYRMEKDQLNEVADEDYLTELVKLNNKPITGYSDWKDYTNQGNNLPIMINPSKPLSDIVKEIRTIKNEHNTEIKILKDIQKEFRIWNKYGVLPYFDLKIWSKLTGHHITNDDIHELIWPAADKPFMSQETIKKTTSRYIKKIFTQSLLDRL